MLVVSTRIVVRQPVKTWSCPCAVRDRVSEPGVALIVVFAWLNADAARIS